MSGRNALVRYAFAKGRDIPGNDWWYPGWATESFKMDRPGVQDGNISASGNEGDTENLMATGTWSLSAEPNSESFVAMRAHQHGFYEQLAAPAVGVGLIELRDYDPVNDDPVAHYLDSLNFGIWRDVESSLREYMAWEAKVSEFTLTANANQYVKYEHSGLYLRDTYMGPPSEVAANAAYTGSWERRGHRRAGDKSGPAIAWRASGAGAVGVAELVWGSAHDAASLTSVTTTATFTATKPHGRTTGDLVDVVGATQAEYNVTATAITVTSPVAFTYPIVSVSGAPATGTPVALHFGTDEHLIVDDWMVAYDAADVTKGTPREPVEIRPLTNPGDLFTIGDTWRMDAASGKPVAVMSTRGKLTATALHLELNLGSGVIKKDFEAFSLKHGTPREAKMNVGSKYGYKIGRPDQAETWWELTFDRDLDDLDFEDALTAEAPVSAYVKFYGTPIGSTGYDDFAEFTFAKTKVTNAGGTVQSPGDTPEQVVLRAAPSSPGASLCVERYQNSLAGIAPA